MNIFYLTTAFEMLSCFYLFSFGSYSFAPSFTFPSLLLPSIDTQNLQCGYFSPVQGFLSFSLHLDTTVFIGDCTIFMAHLGKGAPVVQRVAEVSSALYLKALIMPLNSAPLYVKRHIIHSYIHIERHNTITHIHSLVPSKVLTIIHLRIHQ